MHKRISLIAGLTALFAMGSAGAQVAPVCAGPLPSVTPQALTGDPLTYDNINKETGHTYVVYRATGITWEQARCWVANQPAQGGPDIKPHLATITSSSENKWIVGDLLTPVLSQLEGGRTQVWVGGFRDATAPGGWRWVNNEGPFPSVNNGTVFANWATSLGEPNNQGTVENGVTLGRYSDYSVWNDEGSAPGTIGGFVVEYDTPKLLGTCDGTTTKACTTIDGQTLTFPADSFESGDSISFTAFEFNDPRVDPLTGKCSVDRKALKLFEHLGPEATLTIPEYLCGSPKFLVVKVDSSDLNIIKGAVAVLNKTDEILPGNKFKCSDPIVGNAEANPDPQFQDVIVWQSTDPRLMLEGPAGTLGSVGVGPITGLFAGTATEATNGCSSTKGLVRTGSYFVVGMHIDFNLADAYPLNAEANYASFVDLTKYKLNLLLQSVRNARSALVIRNPDGQAMESQVRNAINALNANNPESALSSINQFLKKVNDSKYVTTGVAPALLEYNFNGDHLMRGENIAFTLRVKVIPFKPVP